VSVFFFCYIWPKGFFLPSSFPPKQLENSTKTLFEQQGLEKTDLKRIITTSISNEICTLHLQRLSSIYVCVERYMLFPTQLNSTKTFFKRFRLRKFNFQAPTRTLKRSLQSH